ncbi:hypothetical protein [Klebsiella michiganensis]|uniref:hypothetical protein n=1 Tax=Klebsiella michiganensis TaxID=1134687 RepID=UPI0036D3FDDB
MTDITKLAQREKFEAWAEERCALPWGYLKNRRTNTGYFSKHDYTSLWAAWKAAGAELVEALEKAQGMEAYWKTQCRGITDHCEELQARIAELESRTVTAAASDVLAERQRQVTAEGWTAGHDDEYEHGELADAAGCYALSSELFDCAGEPPRPWPWPDEWWKPTNRRRDLVKAGALILAEIERIDRAAGIKWEGE